MAELQSSDDEEYWLDWLHPLPNYTKKLNIRRNLFDELEEENFLERFRLGKLTVLKLLEEIESKLEFPTDRNNSVSPINQLLITLRFYATGTFQLVIGDAFGVHKSTACRIIHKVTEAIASLSVKYVRFPNDEAARKITMRLFYAFSNFPGLIGAIDCTHVPVSSPGGEYAEVFRNRKGYFSLSIQLVTDPELYITDVVARWPGSVHDRTIFDFSNIRAQFELGGIPEGSLIGDGGYPLRSYLLTPIQNPQAGPEQRYNHCHVQARNCVERVNGILKKRFPCLKYGLRVHLKKIPTVVMATVILHNIAIMMGDTEPPEDVELSQFINERRSHGFNLDFEEIDAIPYPIGNNQGFSGRRKSLIEGHFS